MGTGWRRAFCTSVRRDPPDAAAGVGAPESPVLKSCSRVRLGFFSTAGAGDGGSCPVTPRAEAAATAQMQQQPLPDVLSAGAPSLRCRTKCMPPPAAPAAAQLREGYSKPTTPVSSNPSSPRSPSRFALLRLRLSRATCGVCFQSVKTGQGRAIFTAECSHAFHFPCIAAHVRKQGALVCPVCNARWQQVPVLSDHLLVDPCGDPDEKSKREGDILRGPAVAPLPHGIKTDSSSTRGGKPWGIKSPRSAPPGSPKTPPPPPRVVAQHHKYDDDEPLLSPGGARFNPIAEEDESESESGDDEFRGFFSANTPRSEQYSCGTGTAAAFGGLQLALAPDVLLLSPGRTHDKYVVALKVKAPPAPTASMGRSAATGVPLLDSPRRAPVDLVTVLDVGGSMTGAKLNMLKRAVRLVVSSLGPADRLAIIGSAAAAKRLLPLRRMTPQAQRAARRIVDGLVCGEGCCVGDALRKATRVLEDRRERNPVASIMLLSDGHQQQQMQQQQQTQQCYPPPVPPQKESRYRRLSSFPQHRAASAPGTRFAHVEIPVQQTGAQEIPHPAAAEDAFAKCVGGLLSVVVQDVRLHLSFPAGEITAVYSASGQPAALGVGGESIRLGDLYADEERELLVEIRVPINLKDHHAAVLNARCAYRDPATHELVASPSGAGGEKPMAVPLPRSLPPPSSAATNPRTVRLHNLYVATRAIVEARRLADLADFGTALHLLLSARAVILQSSCAAAEGENLAFLDAELAEMQRRREDKRRAGPREPLTPAAAWRMGGGGGQCYQDDGGEPLTPTSAWRAAEKLAKVAIMRKSINRVSDLHGFENARF